MHEHHHRQMAGLLRARRITDVAMQMQPVACGEFERLLGGHFRRVDPRRLGQQGREFVRVAIEQVERARIGVGRYRQHAQPAIAGTGNDARILARELLHQRQQGLRGWRGAVEQRHSRTTLLEADAHDLVPGGTEDEGVRLDGRVAPQRREFSRRRIPAANPESAALRRAGEIGNAVVRGKSPRVGA